MDLGVAHLLVAGGSAAAALAAVLWALRVTDGARGTERRLQGKLAQLEDKVQRADSLFSAHPGLVLVWDDDPGSVQAGARPWGAPRVYGSPLALASLLRFAEGATEAEPAVRILQGLAAFAGRDSAGSQAYLAPKLAALRAEGAAFSMTIAAPGGLHVEVDGRTAGSRAVLWIADANARGIEEGGAAGRMDPFQIVARDPAAFLEMLDRAPVLAWRVSGGGRLEWANAAYLEAMGAKGLDQAVARNLALDSLAAEQARRAIEAGGGVEETRWVVLGGERRALRIAMFPIGGGVGAVAIDVTEAAAGKEAHERTVRAHDETLDALAEGVAVFGPDKRLVFHNRAFATLWGLDPGFLAARPTHGAWLDALKERRRLPAHAHYGEWRAGELMAYEDAEGLEETLWHLPQGRTLRIARQRHPLGGLLLIFSDITDEITLRSRYNALVQTQRAALDRLHEAIAVFGLDGECRLYNAKFETLWGLRSEDLGERFSFERMIALCRPLHHDEGQWREIKGRITDPSPEARQPSEGDMRRSDGRIIHYLTRPLPDGATLVAFLDQTAEKNLEEALRDKAEANAAADRLKTEIMQNIAYQLRTPLQTIHGYAEVLSKFMAGPLNDRQRDHLTMILAASDGLSKMIDNILDVAMIEAGKLDLDLAEVTVGDIIREAGEMAQASLREAEVTLKYAADPELGTIEADGKRLKQLLFNLVSNALRSTDPGDVITIGGERGLNEIRLFVSDTGRGMPFEAQAGAFDPFASGDGAVAGLGLSLVKAFAELHGGWVGLASEPGAGATVTCHLPLRPVDRRAA